MKHVVLSLCGVVVFAVATSAASAACYADYKAKRENPLRLQYGVIELRNGCDQGSARSEVADRLAQQGWTLLNVMSVFGPEGLQSRKDSAGPNFLRF